MGNIRYFIEHHKNTWHTLMVVLFFFGGAVSGYTQKNVKNTPTVKQTRKATTGFKFVGSLGGKIVSLEISDHYVLLLRSRALEILDVANPDQPYLLSRMALPGQVTDMAVDGHTAFIGVKQNGVHIIDFSNPRAPQERGFISLRENDIVLQMEGAYLGVWGHYKFEGDYQYLNLKPSPWKPTPSWQEDYRYTDRNHAIDDVVLRLKPDFAKKTLNLLVKPDATKAEHLALTFPLQEGKNSPELLLHDKTGVILSNGCAQLIDLSQPTHPVALGSIAIPWDDYWKVDGDFDRFILLSSYTGTNYFANQPRLALLDLADPRKPKFIPWDYTPPRLDRAWFIGSLLIARITFENEKDNSDKRYSYSLVALDLSNPAKPIERKVPLPKTMSYINPLIQGKRLYALTADGNLRILDCSSPAEIRLRGMCTGLDSSHSDAAIAGPMFYSCDSEGLKIIDVSNPDEPRLRGHYDAAAQDVRTVAVTRNGAAGPVALVVNGSGQLESIRVGNPAKLEAISRLKLDGEPLDIKVRENIACIAAGSKGVLIADIAQPEHPSLLASIQVPGIAKKLAFMGRLLLVATEEDGLKIYDLNNPKSPIILGNYHMRYSCRDLAVRDQLVYLACSDLDIVNLADPAHPVLAGRLPHAIYQDENDFHASCILLNGRIAYTPQYIDISQIAAPKLIGSSDDGRGKEEYVAKAGQYVFILNRDQNSGGAHFLITAADATIPTNPRAVSKYNTLSDTYTLVVDDNGLIYVADGEGGLILLRLETGK